MTESVAWVIALAVLVVGSVVTWFVMTDGWTKRGLYVWRTRKPHAFFGLPVVGRHTAYVGQTGSRRHRDRQHLFGTATGPPADWSDLSPRAYPLPCFLPGWKRAREVQERLWILVLLPVYNHQGNLANPRRIPLTMARAMRLRRQGGGRRVNLGYAIVRAPVTAGLLMLTVYAAQKLVLS